MPAKRTSLNDFCKNLKKYDNFLLSCHVMPEGDAIGSILAIDSLLRRLGKKTTVVCDDVFPARLGVLSHKRWNEYRKIKNKKKKFDALVTTDCPTLGRIGRVKDLTTKDTVIFNIDHHVSNDNFGHYNFVQPKAGACGQVVYEIFKQLKMPINKEEAVNLYVSIVTDTGSFKYSNTTVECHRIASELIAKGIDIERINDQIYSTYSLEKVKLYSHLLSGFKVALGGKVAWTSMRSRDVLKAGATYEDSEGFIDFLKYLEDAKVVFFMTEMPNEKNKVRVSFRGKGRYDVNRLAMHFNGGGHKKSSGCVIEGSLKYAEEQILKAVNQYYHFT